MDRSTEFSSTNISRMAALLVLPLVLGMTAFPRLASANQIRVNIGTEFDLFGGCSLRGAILNHNNKNKTDFRCGAGSGDDQIVFDLQPVANNEIHLGDPLPAINGTLKITGARQNNDFFCTTVVDAAYVTISQGATVSFDAIGFNADGSNQRSVIENNGGTLNIQASPNGPCRYSNNKRGRPVVSGAILVNRFNGTTTISGANFVDSSADPANGQSSKGGAINVDSGTVTIDESITTQPNNFTNDTADQGGAIYVNSGATLNITSNNFLFVNNASASGGAAIYNNGGSVNIKRGAATLTSVFFNNNKAGTGGAIYSEGGTVSIDGVVFGNNTAGGSGGAVVLSNVKPNPASITRSYFHDNSAGVNGGAVYVTSTSILNAFADTFRRDSAKGQGSGIDVDSLGTLKVLNSTFLGTATHEGIIVASGDGEVTFSTLLLTDLGLSPGSLKLSNSILRGVDCGAGVLDENQNLQFQTSGCPSSIPTMNPDLSGALLADNGGPTLTVTPLAGSPVIGAIPNGSCTDQEDNPVTTDQRVFTRPATGPGGPCTIGALEFGAKPASGGIGGIPPGI